MSTHYVYKAFDETGRLVYAGRTMNFWNRVENHRNNAWWTNQVRKIKVRTFSNKEAAAREERRIIVTENPRWNIIGKWSNNPDWSEQDFHDYVTACLNTPYSNTAYNKRRIERVRRLFRQRFGHSMSIMLPRPEIKSDPAA